MLIGEDFWKEEHQYRMERALAEKGDSGGLFRKAALTVVIGSIVLAACGAPVETPAIQAGPGSVNTLHQLESQTPDPRTPRSSDYYSTPEMWPVPPAPAFGEEPTTGPR